MLAPLAATQNAARNADHPGFDARDAARGVVVDTSGRPVPEARVHLQAIADRGVPPRTVGVLLRALPLPPVVVDDNGSFLLPISELHRAALGGDVARFVLVAEAPGYQAWREPLHDGLRGFLGTRAVLWKVRGGDRLELDCGAEAVGGVAAGGAAAVGGVVQFEARVGEELFERLEVPIGAAGRAVVPVRPAPTPYFGPSFEPRPFVRRVRVVCPGASTAWSAVKRGPDGLRAAPWRPLAADAEVARVRDAGRCRGLRALYRCGDRRRWFALRGAEVPGDALLRPLAVAADGMAAEPVTAGEEVVLRPADVAEPCVLRVGDERGVALTDAEVEVWPLVTSGAESRKVLPPPRPLQRARTDGAGLVRLAGRALRGPCSVRVRREGYTATEVIDPRSGGGPHDVALAVSSETGGTGPSARAELRIVDDRSAAVRHAWLLRVAGGVGDVPADELVRRTDGDGVASVLRSSAAAADRVLVVGRGCASQRCAVEDDGAGQLVELQRVATVPIRVVDATDEARVLPGAAIWIGALGRGVRPPVRGAANDGAVHADGYGRALVRVPAHRTDVQIGTRRRLLRHAPVHDVADGVATVAGLAEKTLQVLLPEGAHAARTTTIRGGSSSTGGLRSPAAEVSATEWLLRWRMDDEQRYELRVGLGMHAGAGPPLRVTDAAVEAAAEVRPGLLRLDQRVPLRRRRVVFDGVDGIDPRLASARFESPHFGGVLYSQADGELLAVDDDGVVWLQTRDRDGGRARLLHPDLQPVAFDLPAPDPAGEPLRLTPERGARLTLRLPAAGEHRVLSLHLDPQGRGGTAFRMQSAAPRGDGVVDFRFPTGLAPGAYELDTGGRGGLRRRVAFEIDAALTPVVVDLRADADGRQDGAGKGR